VLVTIFAQRRGGYPMGLANTFRIAWTAESSRRPCSAAARSCAGSVAHSAGIDCQNLRKCWRWGSASTTFWNDEGRKIDLGSQPADTIKLDVRFSLPPALRAESGIGNQTTKIACGHARRSGAGASRWSGISYCPSTRAAASARFCFGRRFRKMTIFTSLSRKRSHVEPR
jgi:hypothetical protein